MTSRSELKTQANSPYNDGYTREFYQQELDKMDTKKRVNTDAYLEFVNGVTSQPSKDADAFEYRIQELRGQGFETHRLLTAAVGLCAESGEFTEIVKKIIFQGKPVTEENLFHLKRELGDVMWYVAQACMGLNVSLDEIIEMNVDKLKSRYPGGEFDVHQSENRVEGDV